MLLDYWLLKIFGASAFWLRLPSIVSGLVFLLAALYIFRLWKLPYLWQCIGLLALGSHPRLMHFVGEARPYIQLATATVCILAYYMSPYSYRERILFRLFGLFSVLLGVLFHPYFSVYWLSIAIFTHAKKYFDQEIQNFSLRSLLSHVDLRISIPGVLGYYLISSSTWLRGRPDFNFDPFELLQGNGVVQTFYVGNFQFLDGYTYPFMFVLLASLIFIGIQRRSLFKGAQAAIYKELLFSITLIFMALGLSMVLSAVSFSQSYWILPRQWVASMALVTLGSVWFLYCLSRLAESIYPLLPVVLTALFCVPLVGNAYLAIEFRLPPLTQPINSTFENGNCSHNYQSPPDLTKLPKSNDEWVCLANDNILAGGEVWDVFKFFYEKDFDR